MATLCAPERMGSEAYRRAFLFAFIVSPFKNGSKFFIIIPQNPRFCNFKNGKLKVQEDFCPKAKIDRNDPLNDRGARLCILLSDVIYRRATKQKGAASSLGIVSNLDSAPLLFNGFAFQKVFENKNRSTDK